MPHAHDTNACRARIWFPKCKKTIKQDCIKFRLSFTYVIREEASPTTQKNITMPKNFVICAFGNEVGNKEV
ncbi:Protein of unknown function [Gryllus bimaculatus]|nr:Protein of unknown function [Gryllus bimaculatus]